MTLSAWRRGHRWGLLFGFAAALGSSFALPAAGGTLLAGLGTGLRPKASWLGRRELDAGHLFWVPVDRLSRWAGRPTGRRVPDYRLTGIGAGDAAPGGGRRA